MAGDAAQLLERLLWMLDVGDAGHEVDRRSVGQQGCGPGQSLGVVGVGGQGAGHQQGVRRRRRQRVRGEERLGRELVEQRPEVQRASVGVLGVAESQRRQSRCRVRDPAPRRARRPPSRSGRRRAAGPRGRRPAGAAPAGAATPGRPGSRRSPAPGPRPASGARRSAHPGTPASARWASSTTSTVACRSPSRSRSCSTAAPAANGSSHEPSEVPSSWWTIPNWRNVSDSSPEALSVRTSRSPSRKVETRALLPMPGGPSTTTVDGLPGDRGRETARRASPAPRHARRTVASACASCPAGSGGNGVCHHVTPYDGSRRRRTAARRRTEIVDRDHSEHHQRRSCSATVRPSVSNSAVMPATQARHT